ncbi:MAG TPA: YggS family pyridoxal phosphate-dependent enzyme [Anaerolineae bacterium]|nr:YggS family pyridoxal phosphate-dependent enzyme [Anaerolineae bacterium]HQI85875.1 YggS family pyridoxal phosphate-dependent enzyme [Anaerolineae bacterium]
MVSDPLSAIVKSLERTRARIVEAALRVGRDPVDVRLVAVTKTFPVDAILAAWDAGQRDFGENRPEEGVPKVLELAARLATADAKPVWHMIGHIQRRKASLVVDHFAMVHAIDRLALAQKLSALAVEAGRELPVLLECNVSGEASKYGYQAAGWERDAALRERLYAEVAAVLALPGLRLEGVMTMAPLAEEAEAARPVFASLRGLRDALREHFPGAPLPHLSMGMTDDFEVAIEEGATLVRIGRAIFGPYQA